MTSTILGSVLAAGMASVSLTANCLPPQEPTPAQPTPQEPTPPQPTPPRSPRPRWQATLSLPTDLWHDVTATTIGAVGDWTNKVELADLDGDGRVDVLFANGGDYEAPGVAVPSRVFRNVGSGERWPEVTKTVFGDFTGFVRVIKVRDVDGDGAVDVFVGATFQTQSRLFRGDGKGGFVDATATHLPAALASVGDAEFGDVDGDGDLDLVLADWGPGSPMKNDGAPPRLWRNEAGRFVAVADAMPAWAVKFCWELELLDVDGDFDLDLLCSSKRSLGSFLAHNDGSGRFVDATAGRLPQFTNNYEFEPMDVNGDGVLDVVTINDGVAPQRFTEHLLLGDGKGGFVDATATHWPVADNPRFDDNMIVFLDHDSDGDADFLIGSLDGPDRLLVNDGKGNFRAAAPVFAGDPTHGTLGIAIADLDGDRRLDVVHAQGEVAQASDEKVFFGKSLAPDTAPPVVGPLQLNGTGQVGAPLVARVRVHDRKSPCMPHDWREVVLVGKRGGESVRLPMAWYGEYLFRAVLPPPTTGEWTFHVEATDAAGNETVGPAQSVTPR